LIDGSGSAVGFIKEMRANPIVTIKGHKLSDLGFAYYQVYENDYTYTEEFFKNAFRAALASVALNVEPKGDIFMGETDVIKLVEELKELKEALTSSKSIVEDEPTPCHVIDREDLLKESITSAFGLAQDGVRSFETGAIRDTSEGKPPMELMPWDLMDRLANHYGKGATKFGANNWRLGQPKSAVFASMMRHLIKYFMGMEDEDHLAALVWGGFNLMHTDKYYSNDKYLNDLQSYQDNIKERK
jgi:hypothetical protein